MKIRNIFYATIAVMTVFNSCSKVDNYDGPTETISGIVKDKGTGKGLQTEVSGEAGNGTRIKMLEISWSDNPTPLYLASKMDGSYINTKMFMATYQMIPEGAFVPLKPNEIKTIEAKGGSTVVDFEVEPFLRVDWEGTPVVNADGTVSVKVKVTRGTNQTEFHKNLMDITLFINNNPYVGNNNYDSRFSPRISFTGQMGNASIGEIIELKSITPLPAKRDWYIRAGARVAHGLNIYNYSEPQTVTIP